MEKIILFGGASHEHEISIVSAIALKKVLGANLKFIFICTDRRFWLIAPEQMRAEFFASRAYKNAPELRPVRGGFEQRRWLGAKTLQGRVINLVHGGDGEDGHLAGLLGFLEIPYIGPRLEASVMSFNKAYTKALAHQAEVNALTSEVITRDTKPTLPFPLILKPLRLGSSIGVSVVHEESQLDYALDVAFEFDDQVLIEPFIKGVQELNLAGCRTAEGWRLSIIEEPAKAELLDFDQKYLDFARTRAEKEVPLDGALKTRLHEAFKRIYDCGFAGALIRCDFFVIEGQVYLNEVNPIPGSLSNYLFEDFETVLDEIALPKARRISVDYRYIHTIRSAKGKA
jgi:D-alanine-D-alanine ligase